MDDRVKIGFRTHATRAVSRTPAERAERAYRFMIMDIIYHHDLHDALHRHGIRGAAPQARAVMTDMNERY